MANHNRIYLFCSRDVRGFGGPTLWLAFRCLPALLMALLLMLLLSGSPARATEEGAHLNELESGHLMLRPAGGAWVPAVIHDSKVHFDINGLVATVHLQQRFRNDTGSFVEGVYAFPLPPDAAVRAMEMEIGERRIVGRVRERAEAKKIYEAAKTAGKKASLVEQQRPNLFTNRVANIAPGEEVSVHLELVQPVAYDNGVFSLRFPTTITPRFMPGSPLPAAGDGETLVPDPYLGWATATDEVPDAAAISPVLNPAPGSDHAPVNPIEISATLDAGMPLAGVASAYHDVALTRRAGVYSLSLVDGLSEMDRDFVLEWEPATGSAPRAALFTEKVGESYYGMVMVVPPAVETGLPEISRELVLVVDTSGSMGGVSIRQARASVARALQQLRPADRFNIIEFNTAHRALYREPMPATPHHLAHAQEFVRRLDASGGTNMMPALQAALAPSGAEDAHRDSATLRQVVFITDGAVGNEQALFEAIARQLGDSRLFTVGIGSAPNSWFMREAARFGRGTHTHIGDIGEVGQKMAALFDQLARPAAVDLRVQWPQSVEAWPARIPDLYHGQPLSVAVSFGETRPAGEVQIHGNIGGRAWSRRLQLTHDPAARGHDGIASVWARRKIAGLLEGLVTGREESAVRADVLPLALAHRLLSPYTSFVAVEEVISRPEGEGSRSEPVANSRPRGQSHQPFAYPRTATTGPAKAWFAALALFLALLLRVVRQGEADRVLSVAP